MQAEAAGIAPCVEMNPILLKPASDMGSQVIVNGKVRGMMPAREYYRYKKALIPDILKAYETLSDRHDIVVIEGAGSPAEINLKQDDIVNMGLAQMVKAPVLLVGDIDRGGVFAQLVGTLALLEEQEREMVKGFVINKFRGDVEILKPGLSVLEERTGKQVRGVIPYVTLDLDDEDSLSERLENTKGKGRVDIAAIHLPRISNFTDLNVLSCYEDISVRYVRSLSQFGEPDLIVLPGTKNTLEDLKWLKESGLAAKIQRAAGDTRCWETSSLILRDRRQETVFPEQWKGLAYFRYGRCLPDGSEGQGLRERSHAKRDSGRTLRAVRWKGMKSIWERLL